MKAVNSFKINWQCEKNILSLLIDTNFLFDESSSLTDQARSLKKIAIDSTIIQDTCSASI
jgi:hypothetical protein